MIALDAFLDSPLRSSRDLGFQVLPEFDGRLPSRVIFRIDFSRFSRFVRRVLQFWRRQRFGLNVNAQRIGRFRSKWIRQVEGRRLEYRLLLEI